MKKNQFRQDLPPIKTIVVKAGSRILTANGNITQTGRVRNLISDIVEIKNSGVNVLLVSSGAVAHGMISLGISKRPTTIPMQQACASIGQIRLMQMYSTMFEKHSLITGQVLLSWDDLRDKQRYLNLRNTLFKLLDSSVIPIINENDSVGVDEIKFGDNDTLSAHIAMLVGADLLTILTDIDGLYDDNPQKNKNAQHIEVVKKITPSIHKLAGDTNSSVGVGGMQTKLKAAEMVTKAGTFAIVGNGFTGRLSDLLKQKKGTIFLPTPQRMSSKRRWLAFSGRIKGSIIIDDGATTALIEKGKSLLPAGIKNIEGLFKVGDMVEIKTLRGKIIARGIVNYKSKDIEKIKGCKSREIIYKLGNKSFDEIIHRNNMVII